MAPNTDGLWEDYFIDQPRLHQRAMHYAFSSGAPEDMIEALRDLLDSTLGQSIVFLSRDDAMCGCLLNDAYKAKMHNLYSTLAGGLDVDFALHVRKAAVSLKTIKDTDPQLYRCFERDVQRLATTTPLPPVVQDVLHWYYNFDPPQVMIDAENGAGVGSIQWEELDGEWIAIASGSACAASNVETSLTQLVQEYGIAAQVRRHAAEHGCNFLDRTERLANSLGHLAGVVGKLNGSCHNLQISLFAGRRSSDRAYLLLQNVFCAQHLQGYTGTSSIFSAVHVDGIMDHLGTTEEQRQRLIVRLQGTLAHELISIMGQMMSKFDDEAGRSAVDGGGSHGPLQLSALLAHLLFLRVNGGLEGASALADTYGTAAFVALAAVTPVPQEFVDDMKNLHPTEPPIPSASTVFDVLRIWRLDSGDYSAAAEVVMSAWEQRCRELWGVQNATPRSPPPRPILMHSNLSSVDDVIRVARLPDRIRPSIVGFGSLADGFLPFDCPAKDDEAGGHHVTLMMSSIVMKAVQARHPDIQQVGGSSDSTIDGSVEDGGMGASKVEDGSSVVVTVGSAGKLGDGGGSKAQVDPRLPRGIKDGIVERMTAMSCNTRNINGPKAGHILADMYHQVTRKLILS